MVDHLSKRHVLEMTHTLYNPILHAFIQFSPTLSSLSFSIIFFSPLFFYVYLCTEWTGYQGGEIEEATEGKEKQGQEDPWCKEGTENNSVSN